MPLQIDKEFVGCASKCSRNFACLAGCASICKAADPDYIGAVQIVKDPPGNCAYHFANTEGHFCTCPVRQETFRKYLS